MDIKKLIRDIEKSKKNLEEGWNDPSKLQCLMLYRVLSNCEEYVINAEANKK